MSFGFRKPEDLPVAVPVFPLSGALLLPRAPLPLNIFEPRYLNMIDDALGGDRLIGMIQTAGADEDAPPRLADVGCVGRITSFTETDDGRYLITLTGVTRFGVSEELSLRKPYRVVRADWRRFADDLSAPLDTYQIDRDALSAALRRYVDANGFKADWSLIADAPPEALIHTLCAVCPFEPGEKQLLLEAKSLQDRSRALITLLDMNTAPDIQGPLQ
jgi:uncharacterized protein